MKRTLISAIGFAFLLTWAQPAPTQDLASQLVGVWKWTSQSVKEVATGKISHPYGEKPAGHIVYTKGGHVAFVLAGDNRKAPAGASATDAERINLFNTIAAGSGTYKVEGNTIIVTYEASWNQTWTGITQKRQFEIVGNKLTVTSEPTKNLSGQDIIFVVTYERVE
ncbi:lipocalin-like domain-containing protein [Bradyrhizobium sp. SRL28]|uniref:lipocalin-like domain-containing protein n=1 Tax=Bradyrhizobium sp. SRL28 TaxID=2836178 RepID=UPI001BDE6E9C|nr:lipocalin-like domain-containing protein [Bradyrhizobium sp. SRL28]MBT1512558.1 lipocalin-like domain-containing protein [Bradyrhizobium sp. SRL28]